MIRKLALSFSFIVLSSFLGARADEAVSDAVEKSAFKWFSRLYTCSPMEFTIKSTKQRVKPDGSKYISQEAVITQLLSIVSQPTTGHVPVLFLPPSLNIQGILDTDSLSRFSRVGSAEPCTILTPYLKSGRIESLPATGEWYKVENGKEGWLLLSDDALSPVRFDIDPKAQYIRVEDREMTHELLVIDDSSPYEWCTIEYDWYESSDPHGKRRDNTFPNSAELMLYSRHEALPANAFMLTTLKYYFDQYDDDPGLYVRSMHVEREIYSVDNQSGLCQTEVIVDNYTHRFIPE